MARLPLDGHVPLATAMCMLGCRAHSACSRVTCQAEPWALQ